MTKQSYNGLERDPTAPYREIVSYRLIKWRISTKFGDFKKFLKNSLD